jgi:hypothetical protein
MNISSKIVKEYVGPRVFKRPCNGLPPPTQPYKLLSNLNVVGAADTDHPHPELINVPGETMSTRSECQKDDTEKENEAKRPKIAPSSGTTLGWAGIFEEFDGWRCKKCLSPNDKEATKCKACEEPRQNEDAPTSSTDQSSTTLSTSLPTPPVPNDYSTTVSTMATIGTGGFVFEAKGGNGELSGDGTSFGSQGFVFNTTAHTQTTTTRETKAYSYSTRATTAYADPVPGTITGFNFVTPSSNTRFGQSNLTNFGHSAAPSNATIGQAATTVNFGQAIAPSTTTVGQAPSKSNIMGTGRR